MRPAGTLHVLESRMPESSISAHLSPVQHKPPMQGSSSHSPVWACQTALCDLPFMSSATSKKRLVTSSHNTYNELWWVDIQTYANERGQALKRSICKLKLSLNKIPLITENMPFSTQNKCNSMSLSLFHCSMEPQSSAHTSKDNFRSSRNTLKNTEHWNHKLITHPNHL